MQTVFGDIPDRFANDMSMADRHDYLHRRMTRRTFIRGAAIAAGTLAAGPTLWRQSARAAATPSGVRLAYGSDPTRQMVISWATAEPISNPFVELGHDGGLGTKVAAETRTVAGTSTLYHHAVVSGLAPGEGYVYRIGGEGDLRTLTTAPDEARPFTFSAFGDQGVSANAGRTTALVGSQNPAFHLHAGDLCYAYSAGSGGPPPPNTAVWDQWLGLISPLAATTPWMVAVGNHEMENGYGPQGYDGVLGRFTLPGGGPVPVVYAFRYANAAFISLDGNDASSELTHNRGWTQGAQDAWLRKTLQELRRDPAIDFVVAQFHHCAYCTNAVHASDGGVRNRWGAIFDEFTVDLVINGHNHCYERTHPVRNGQPTAEVPKGGEVEAAKQGTVYVTAGGGGQAAYQASLFPSSYVIDDSGARVPEMATWSAVRYLDLSVVLADVTPAGADGVARMTLRALSIDGQEIDRLTLVRRRTSLAEPSASTTASQGSTTGEAAAGSASLPATGGRQTAVGPMALAAAGAAAAALARGSRQEA